MNSILITCTKLESGRCVILVPSHCWEGLDESAIKSELFASFPAYPAIFTMTSFLSSLSLPLNKIWTGNEYANVPCRFESYIRSKHPQVVFQSVCLFCFFICIYFLFSDRKLVFGWGGVILSFDRKM